MPHLVGLRKLKTFLHDRSGVGGVEFALIAPMLLVLYLSAFELTIGLSIAKKTSVASSTITDLITQTDKVDKADLLVMEDVAKSIFVPYPSRALAIKVTGIVVDNTGAPTVAWSWANSGAAPYPVGNAVNIPEGMDIAGTFLVRTELSVEYDLMMYLPSLTGTSIQKKTIRREFFFRQRVGERITCSDC